jgi:hypothetical protein
MLLCGCETWSLTLREKHRLRVSRRIFGLKRDEVTGSLRKLLTLQYSKKRGLSVFKNFITCTKLWTDEEAEIIAIEVKGIDPNYSWEIIGIYRAPNEDMLAIERLVCRSRFSLRSRGIW